MYIQTLYDNVLFTCMDLTSFPLFLRTSNEQVSTVNRTLLSTALSPTTWNLTESKAVYQVAVKVKVNNLKEIIF